ncbi:MAG: hypothetical protein ACE5J9_02870 [Methanosarcinales archaeon]
MSIWKELGFKENPYDPRPLKPVEEDAKLFVGRSEESKQFAINVSSLKGGSIIVEGRIGVGKTSFVNIQQYRCWKSIKNFLPSFETVLIQDNTDSLTFMLSSLSNALHSLMKIHREKEIKNNQVFNEVLNNISKTSVLGSGAGATKTIAPSQPIAVVMPTILHLAGKFIKELQKFGYEGVIIPINNLDIIDESIVANFLSQIRDIALIREGFIWVLIGQEGLFSALESRAPRVSEVITGSPILLKPLSLREVKQAIERRIATLKLRESVDLPIHTDIIELLYEVSGGEIRFIFKRSTDLLLQFALQFPTEKGISFQIGKQMLRELARKKINSLNLTKRELDILDRMANLETFRIRDCKIFGLKTPQALNRYVRKFSELGLLTKVQEKKLTNYRATGDVKILFTPNNS